jgi:hypothetical protein
MGIAIHGHYTLYVISLRRRTTGVPVRRPPGKYMRPQSS